MFSWTVHGMEYGFGAHDYPSSGVFEVEPRSCPDFIYRRSVLLGGTDMSLCQRLTGKPMPTWVNRMARVGSFYNCLLPESLQVAAVRHLPGRLTYAGKICLCRPRHFSQIGLWL
ncbi:hypothetical protein K1719_012005 [Acacia pycnantha]|nr:hypothetical protein K1719_012005 [Acacia pycnantha]